MPAKQPADAQLHPTCPKRPRLDLTAGQLGLSHPAAKLIDEYDKLTEEIFEELIKAIKDRKMAEAATKFMNNLKHVVNSSLDIAVVGESGSGKSSFINAIRGLGDEDEGAAPTGVQYVAKTIQPTPYLHPKHSNVTVWDLPGIDNPDFQASTYLQQVDLSRYDFLILITSKHFKSNHAQLAHEVQKLGKLVYFVRSKVDADLEAAKKQQRRGYKEETVLGKIQKDCHKSLWNEGIGYPKVFLLSSRALNKYDFMAFEETVEKELPGHKRYAFILGLPNISLDVSQKKKEAFLKQIWKLAFVSCGMAALTIQGLSVTCDMTTLMESLTKHWHNTGLDGESLDNLVEKVAGSMEEIKAVINSTLANENSGERVQNLLTKVGGGVVTVMQQLLNTVPIFGSLVPGGNSLGINCNMLQKSLNEVAADAQRVLMPLNRMFEKVLNLTCG